MVIFKFDFAGSIFPRTKFSQFSPAGLFKVFIVLLLTYSFGFYSVSDFIRGIDSAGKVMAVRLRQIY